MPVDRPFAHILSRVVIADNRPAFPFPQTVKRFSRAHSLPCQQANEVSQEELNVLAREAGSRLVVTLVGRVINQ